MCDIICPEMRRNNSSLKSTRTICDGESCENLKALAGGMGDSGNSLWRWREGLAAAIVTFFFYPASTGRQAWTWGWAIVALFHCFAEGWELWQFQQSLHSGWDGHTQKFTAFCSLAKVCEYGKRIMTYLMTRLGLASISGHGIILVPV